MTAHSQDAVEVLRSEFRSNAGSTANRIYRALVVAVEEQVLSHGARLSEVSLAEAFEVSRTPVREALVRLEAEGHVRRTPGGSLEVRDLSVEQIVETYVVREALDGVAAGLAAGRADALAVQRLSALNEQIERLVTAGRVHEIDALDLRFHRVLTELSGNDLLIDLANQVQRRVRKFRSSTLQRPGRAAESLSEHRKIVAALAEGNGERAARLAREHVRGALAARIESRTGGD